MQVEVEKVAQSGDTVFFPYKMFLGLFGDKAADTNWRHDSFYNLSDTGMFSVNVAGRAPLKEVVLKEVLHVIRVSVLVG